MLIRNEWLKKTFYIAYPHKEHSDHKKGDTATVYVLNGVSSNLINTKLCKKVHSWIYHQLDETTDTSQEQIIACIK